MGVPQILGPLKIVEQNYGPKKIFLVATQSEASAIAIHMNNEMNLAILKVKVQ